MDTGGDNACGSLTGSQLEQQFQAVVTDRSDDEGQPGLQLGTERSMPRAESRTESQPQPNRLPPLPHPAAYSGMIMITDPVNSKVDHGCHDTRSIMGMGDDLGMLHGAFSWPNCYTTVRIRDRRGAWVRGYIVGIGFRLSLSLPCTSALGVVQ